MQKEKKEKLPLDSKLLSDAVIELNISRRSVGLYPPDHPIAKESINRAFHYLSQLFELRVSITLGITKDTLVVDEYILDKKNPVFVEFANVLHTKGIAALTYSSGLSKEELVEFHLLITMKDGPSGKALEDGAREKNISHIKISPLDFSAFGFVDGKQRGAGLGAGVWEEYVSRLIQGKLSADAENKVFALPPEEMASVINTIMPEDTSNNDAYGHVITGYLKRRGTTRISRESIEKFTHFVEALKPEIKRQFLSRSSAFFSGDIHEIEKTIKELSPESFEKITALFSEQASIIPETLRNLVTKLSRIKKDQGFSFDFMSHNITAVHDIEISEELTKLFREDHFKSFVSEDYREDLDKMLASTGTRDKRSLPVVTEGCTEEMIDNAALEIMLEILEADFLSSEDYLKMITKLTESVGLFIDTGRFESVLEVYNTLRSHALKGRFSNHATSMIEYFFCSEDLIKNLILAFRLWGRQNRESSLRLARALKRPLIPHLLESLAEESDASIRKYILFILENLGSDVAPHAVKRLSDDRWFIARNMLYLIRESNAVTYAGYAKKFAKHKNPAVSMEAVKTLLHFKTPEAIPYLKVYLSSENTDTRNRAVRLAGSYKVTEAVPYLVNMLKKKDIFGTETYYKIDVVRALGEIGDKRAVGAFIDIYDSKKLFYKEDLEKLKEEIFSRLDNFPYHTVQPLVERGLRSKNEAIKRMSEKLHNKNTGTQ